MQRQQKTSEVELVTKRFAAAKAAIVTEYRGLTVDQMTQLRRKVRDGGGQLRVVKNRLAKLALKDAPMDGVASHLVGPTAIATADKDPVPLAKALIDFAKDNEIFVVKGGNVEGKAVDVAKIKALADLPSRDVLLAQLLGVMNGTARNLASVLAAVPRGLVTAIKAIGDKK